MRSLAAVAVVLSLSAPMAAQEKLSESVEVRVVNIDVVVTDRSGKSVHGLTKADFEVYQNGRKQVITNLYESSPDAAVAATTTPVTTETTGVATPANDIRKHRILVLVDNYSLDPARRSEVLDAVEKFITTLKRPGDEVALASWNRSTTMVTPFTSDQAALKQGIAKIRTAAKGSLSFQQETERVRAECQRYYDQAEGRQFMTFQEALQLSQGAVASFSEEAYLTSKNLIDGMKATIAAFAGLDGKKVLLLAGAHLPASPGEELSIWVYRTYSRELRNLSALNTVETPRASARINLEEVAALASADDVAMYFIDGGNPGDFSKSVETRGADTSAQEDFMAANNTADAFRRLADVTGGAVVTRTMNFNSAFETISRDLNSYYSLGFKPDETSDNGKPKNITVKVRNPEYIARARLIYTPKSIDSEITQRLVANLVHGGVQGDWPVNVTTGPPAKEGKYFKVPMEISIAPTLTLLPAGSEVAGGYTVYILMGNGGSMSKVMKTVQDVRMPAAAEQEARKQPFTFEGTLVMRGGENVLSIAVVDRTTNVVGYARTTLTAQ